MSKIKEIFATAANKIAHKARDKEFEEYKEQLIERINKAANEGEFNLYVNTCSAKGQWEELKSWLENLGFTVGWSVNSLMAVVKWDDNSITKKITVTESKSSTVEHYGPTPTGVSYAWEFDPHPYDYVCYRCKEHSEYKTKYCPNCGAKMITD